MTTRSPNPITGLLNAARQGDASARDRLWSLIYDELHALAQHQLAAEAPGHRRQPTSLVHEAYLRLTVGEGVDWANRRHFFAAAAQAMRRIRTDDARKRNRLKRGGGHEPSALTATCWVRDQKPAEILAIDEALSQLEAADPRKAEVVTLRYFAGLTMEECAEALGVSVRTVRNEWRFARAWLHAELTKEDHSG